jgi:hypothetical protein
MSPKAVPSNPFTFHPHPSTSPLFNTGIFLPTSSPIRSSAVSSPVPVDDQDVGDYYPDLEEENSSPSSCSSHALVQMAVLFTDVVGNTYLRVHTMSMMINEGFFLSFLFFFFFFYLSLFDT